MDDQQDIQHINFHPNDMCEAIEDFSAKEEGDLSFVSGDKLTIIRESDMLYWYIAKNETGQTGTVPGNYLNSLKPSLPEPDLTSRSLNKRTLKKFSTWSDLGTLPTKPKLSAMDDSLFDEDYQKMSPPTEPPKVPPKPKPKKSKVPILTEAEKQMLALIEREKMKRLAKGTLVIATANYSSKSAGDLHFDVYEELVIIKPMKDLCWYMAHKADNPSVSGIIPLTHVRLVYMSDDDDNDNDDFEESQQQGHEKIYEDKNDFFTNSGWFTYPGLAMGREAVFYLLARKAEIDYDTFMSIGEAIYLLEYMNEKTFVGKAKVLHEELAAHFECFGKRQKDIKEVDDDLCHHTYAAGWKLKVWALDEKDQELEIEHAKKIIQHDSLMSTDGGINEKMTFTSIATFDRFWEWLSPN